MPASVPTPWDSPQKLITSPRRRGEIRSLTTEKPTEATAPSPTAPTQLGQQERAGSSAARAVPSVPAAQISVPSISSGLRLVRSPTYAQPTAATALTR